MSIPLHERPLSPSASRRLAVSCRRALATGLLALPLLTAVILSPARVQAQSTGVLTATLTDLYDFSGGNDGANLNGAPVQGSDGNLYGTTDGGGDANGHGTIYKITPSGVLTTLYRFTGGDDGANPPAGLVQGSDGYLYGTTSNYGPNGSVGTVFRISHTGAFTTLYGFTGGSDGAFPDAPLVQGSDGNFYGSTIAGGTDYDGTVFRITPAGVLTTLANFTDLRNAFSDSLTQGRDGNFYGGAINGGSNNAGALFQITPAGVLTTLYNFTGGTDGKEPGSKLLLGADGNFYGTTYAGGANGGGTVYQITTTGALTTLYSFAGGIDGANPDANLIAGPGGVFFGTTTTGGANGDGTVFEVTPAGMLTTLFAFGDSDANLASSTPVLGSNGSFYFTNNGGTGAIYQLTITSGLSSSGSVQLDTATDNVTEGAGSITVSVSRTGGSAGAISVDYATADDTAVAGTDYQAASGTLTWADGDTADKTITVPILNRNLTSGSTFFLVNLASPTGGALLGAPVQEAVTILDTTSTANIQPPTLLSPPPGVMVSQNKSVQIHAAVEALSGTLMNVEIFAVDRAGHSTDLGGFGTARGHVTWLPTTAGSYTLQVVATDTEGNTQQTTSALTVAAAADAAPPETSLDGNLDSITVPLGATVPVITQAVDSEGNALQNVQFYLDGVPVATTPFTGTGGGGYELRTMGVGVTRRTAADATGTAALFQASATMTRIEQLLTLVGTTAGGVSSVSTPVTIYTKAEAGTPPSATLSNVASGASVTTGQSVSVAATTGSHPIAKVQLVVDNQAVGTATAAPYTFSLPALAAGSHVMSVIATDIGALSSVSAPVLIKAEQTASTPAFFTGEVALADGVYYLAFPNGNVFGYYTFLADPSYIYHFDLGFEYVFDAADGQGGVYFYDFTSNDFFYTSPVFPFPYLYDFNLHAFLYYYPDPNHPGRYNTNGVRYFYDFKTATIISK